jgi:hypothetical protein
MGSGKKFGWVEFLAGFAAGSVFSLLITRKDLKSDLANIQRRAEEIKKHLLSRAKSISEDLVQRSQKFIESSKKFAEGKYSGTIESLEKEYYSLKYAINTAIDIYRKGTQRIKENGLESDELFINFDDETLPKFIGMGRGKRS